MFVGREREKDALNKLYCSDRFEFAVIYGRRRVGKTELIKQILKDREAIYFVGVENNEKQNLENLSKCIMEYDKGFGGNISFASYQDALEYVFKLAEKERLIFVMDEYPYAAKSTSSLPSTIQMLIDKYKDNSKLMLILCGSSMTYMEDKVLSYKSPLYGRRTSQIKLEPLGFDKVCQFFSGLSNEEKAVMYGIVGGTPQYMLQMNERFSIEDNIRNTFLNPASSLFEEPENLLKQEMREPAMYNAIITAIANGATRMSEISTKVGEETSRISAYMKNLIGLGIVKKECPYGESSSRKSIYVIEDNMFRFWYRFVPENISLISRGADAIAYDRIKPHISEYMGHIFEDICCQYLWKCMLEGRLDVMFSDIGRWWGTDPKKRKQVEIDIMGEQDKSTALFGECKWTNEKVDLSVLETLEYRSRLFNYPRTILYLFSKSGFTDGCCEKAAEMGNVKLVTLDTIVAGMSEP